jgi:anti-anti-sigma factor
VEKYTGFFVVSPIGSLDTTTYRQLETILDMIIKSRPKSVVLDLTMLEYISSMGLRVIFKSKKTVQEQGGLLMLTNMQPAVKKIFDIAGAVDQDSVFASVEEADRYYDRLQKQMKEKGS